MRTIPPRPPNQTRVAEEPHPSGGRGFAYPVSFRRFAIRIYQSEHVGHVEIINAMADHDFPSLQSIRRWLRLEQALGHYRPCRRTGNKRAEVLRDHNIIFIALYRITFPKSTSAEVNAFLFRVNYGDPNFRFYSGSQIWEADIRIGMTRKCGSTTAYQAYLPINKQKRWMYWHLPYPYGIADIRVEDLIDLDECGVFVETADRHIGKAYCGSRVRQEGNYSKSEKWNLILAIAGSAAAERWQNMWLDEGTTGDRMIDFISGILQDIGHGTPQRRRCFIMDNLK